MFNVIGEKVSEKDVNLGSWERGESYADDIIEVTTEIKANIF